GFGLAAAGDALHRLRHIGDRGSREHRAAGRDDLVALLHAEEDPDAEAEEHRGDRKRGDLLAPAFRQEILDLLEQRLGAVFRDRLTEGRRLLANREIEIETGGGTLVIVFSIRGHLYSSSSPRRRSPMTNPTPTEISSALPGLERT